MIPHTRLIGPGILSTLADRLRVLLTSYSELFFLNSALAGVVMFAASLTNPHVGLAGLTAVLSAYGLAHLLHIERAFTATGMYIYNALLVGLSVGYLFAIGPQTLLLAAAAGAATFIVGLSLNNAFSLYFKLPMLSLPFVLVTTVVWLASESFPVLYIDSLYVHPQANDIGLHPWVTDFFTALASILFLPEPLIGVVVAIMITLHSRILLLLAVLGYLVGRSIALIMGVEAVTGGPDFSHFNYMLVAMALGGVFLVPSPRSYLIAGIAVAATVLVHEAASQLLSPYGLPAFTLAFNIITLGFLYALTVAGFELLVKEVRATPEDTLDDYLSRRERFRYRGPALALPFSGEWTVWQGFDGRWTHTGPWRHAYDFVISVQDPGGESRTHSGNGHCLEDYFCWNRPVMSPCQGRVIHVVSNQPDNPPGHVDSHKNWGNLIIIETAEGGWVELSHFVQDSIELAVGDWVEQGDELGRCGNSGYSTQPHIHIQMQDGPKVGAATVPFQFRGFIEADKFVHQGRPEEASLVEPLVPDRTLEYRMALPLETRWCYTWSDGNKTTEEGTLSVASNGLGETYLGSDEHRLYFTQDDSNFYFYRIEGDHPALRLLFTTLPRMPLGYRQGVSWSDSLPVGAVASGYKRHLLNLIRAIVPTAGQFKVNATWSGHAIIEGILHSPLKDAPLQVVLHPRLGIAHLTLATQQLTLAPLKPDNKNIE